MTLSYKAEMLILCKKVCSVRSTDICTKSWIKCKGDCISANRSFWGFYLFNVSFCSFIILHFKCHLNLPSVWFSMSFLPSFCFYPSVRALTNFLQWYVNVSTYLLSLFFPSWKCALFLFRSDRRHCGECSGTDGGSRHAAAEWGGVHLWGVS